MKVLMKLLVLQILFLFVIPLALCEISMTLPEKSIYNLGEKITPAVSIKVDQSYYGFFKLSILCDNYDLQYYTTPLSLETGYRTQLSIPDLMLSEPMEGKCQLKSNFEAIDGEKVDSVRSTDFFVTSGLNITAAGDWEAKPGEDVFISGEVKKYSNEIIPEGEAEITFGEIKNTASIVAGEFEHTIHLSDGSEAGSFPLLIVAADNHGNYGSKILRLRVLPIPARIENHFENDMLLPGDSLKVKAILYDPKGSIINSSINVRVFDANEKLIAEKEVQSPGYFYLETGTSQKPGSYILLSSFENIKEQSAFFVQSVRKIAMRQAGSLVYVENTGNIDYDDEITIILESNDEKYIINRKIGLEPGEKITIDLSKEVPQGTYDIILPEETAVSAEFQNEGESKNTWELAERQNIIEDVEINDSRSATKKLFDGLSSVTGAVVGAAGYVASKPLLASIVLISIVILTAAYYSKDIIISKVRKKKSEDTSRLFEDFRFEEKK
ncbi:hypothetical protein KY347_05690 [Candidatus Woesearchaeota archaeon]|nr:hypothetical protein [Candidatus Woesearchaeota archaeon]